ncbi:permease [Methanosarcina sp.]|uniref:permease n=1 Tax=Methanosarcina sp. TaxID=2213 RepID=UPI003C74B785
MNTDTGAGTGAEVNARNISINPGNPDMKPADSGMKFRNKTARSENKSVKRRVTALAKRFRFAIVFAFVIIALYFTDTAQGIKAFEISLSNTKEMLGLIPPVFVLMGLLDAWVPKETFIRYMGEASGLKGVLTALFLGSAAAGPLYIAFPIAALLIKKKAKLAYVFFFLGVWSTTKIPLLMYEFSYMGARFTAIQIAVCIPLFLLLSLIIEKTLSAEDRESLYRKAEFEFS